MRIFFSLASQDNNKDIQGKKNTGSFTLSVNKHYMQTSWSIRGDANLVTATNMEEVGKY